MLSAKVEFLAGMKQHNRKQVSALFHELLYSMN